MTTSSNRAGNCMKALLLEQIWQVNFSCFAPTIPLFLFTIFFFRCRFSLKTNDVDLTPEEEEEVCFCFVVVFHLKIIECRFISFEIWNYKQPLIVLCACKRMTTMVSLLIFQFTEEKTRKGKKWYLGCSTQI